MVLARDDIVNGLVEELGRLELLVRSLGDEAWRAPSRCAGWTAADVAAHVAGQFADVVAGNLDGLGTPEVTEREVAERRGRTQTEIADELQHVAKLGRDLLLAFDDTAWNGPAPPGVAGTLGFGVEALFYDTWQHADDIRAAAGMQTVRSSGLRGAVSHLTGMLTEQGWGPATVALDGMDEFAVGTGGGRRIVGDPLRFVLVAGGRADPADLDLDETVNVYR